MKKISLIGIGISMGLLLMAGWGNSQDIPGKKPEKSAKNILGTMMLEQVEELSEEFNQVEVTYKKKPDKNKGQIETNARQEVEKSKSTTGEEVVAPKK